MPITTSRWTKLREESATTVATMVCSGWRVGRKNLLPREKKNIEANTGNLSEKSKSIMLAPRHQNLVEFGASFFFFDAQSKNKDT